MTKTARKASQAQMQLLAKCLYHALRIMLAGVFLWSGISKGLAPGQFAEVVAAYGLLPPAIIVPVALWLIVVEIAAALGLLLETRGSLTVITLMMVLFLMVLGYGIYLGLDIDCGCFGPDDPEHIAFHNLRGAFVRDVFLLLACSYLYCWRYFKRLTPRAWLRPGLQPVITFQED